MSQLKPGKVSIITPRIDEYDEKILLNDSSIISSSSSSSSSSSIPSKPTDLVQPILPIIKFTHSICPHGSPITVNSFRRQYHGCRRCYLVGSLINSIECGNALGSIALISRNTQSSLIETRCIAKNGMTALGAAASTNDVESMERLMEMNADPEVYDNKGRALFHIACASGSIDVVKEIIKDSVKYWHKKYSMKGIGDNKKKDVKRVHPIKMKDQNDRTPLRWAMKGNHYEVVEFILNHGGKLESDMMEWMEDHKDDMMALKLKKKINTDRVDNANRSRSNSRSSSRNSSRARSRSNSRTCSRVSRSRASSRASSRGTVKGDTNRINSQSSSNM